MDCTVSFALGHLVQFGPREAAQEIEGWEEVEVGVFLSCPLLLWHHVSGRVLVPP